MIHPNKFSTVTALVTTTVRILAEIPDHAEILSVRVAAVAADTEKLADPVIELRVTLATLEAVVDSVPVSRRPDVGTIKGQAITEIDGIRYVATVPV